jgi:hypothetical protein
MRKWVKTFKPEFAPMIKAGTKCSTIRPWPKDGKVPNYGDILDARIWEGEPYHSKQIKIATFEIGSVYKIVINDLGVWHVMNGFPRKVVWETQFAKEDGFDSVDALLNWFRSHYTFPFTGVRIGWQPGKAIGAGGSIIHDDPESK